MERTVQAVMLTLGSLGETIRQAPSSTIQPQAGADTAGRHALETLRRLQDATAERLRPGATLGQGGMGVVKLARQVSVGRDVAVKTLQPEHASDAAILGLLREAWVTGSLEHPNVVPIYDVGLDEMGRPEIVLKRIEGEHWGDLMHDPERIEQRHGADDDLEWNLLVFRQITRAVHFAHSRGIVHRDLKPENVMIGSFGEVYVVDWGIALSLEDDGTGRFRLAEDAHTMAGTPCYMAPEMLGGTESRISERTDVYLLGAMLFELTEGRPPHEGETLSEILSSILASPPHATKAPEELGRIIRRAMDASPEVRFETAESLGLAVDDYLRHRGSRRLEERARDSLVQLERQIAARDRENKDNDTLYGLYRECRFGFREALSAWPDNEMAREGSRRAAEMMIELELSRGDGEAAERLLVDLDAPNPALSARIAAARRQAGAERTRLEAMDADLDIRTGQRTRAIVAGVLGLVWTLMPLAKRHQDPETIYGWTGIASAIGLMVLALGFGYWARESLSRTLPNRRILAVLIFTFVANALLGVGCFMLEVPPLRYHALLLFEWFAIASVLTLTVDKRLWPSAVAFALTFVLAARDPAHVRYIMSVGNLVITLNAVYIWRPAGGYFGKRANE